MSLLHPKWWVLHVFTVAAIITMFYLGRWQWHVAHRHHGDIRYYAYAFQWWAFCGFAAVMWARVVLDYLRTDGTEEADRQPAESGSRSDQPSGYRAYVPPAAQAATDSEQVRFNSYLRALHSDSEGPA